MPVARFVGLTASGSLIWNLVLMSAGWWLGDRFGATVTVSRWLNIVLVGAALAFLGWFVICRLASATVPLVFHCTSGKDRTGVVAALLQTALGVDDDIVVAEYLASAENLVGHMEMMKTRYPRHGRHDP